MGVLRTVESHLKIKAAIALTREAGGDLFVRFPGGKGMENPVARITIPWLPWDPVVKLEVAAKTSDEVTRERIRSAIDQLNSGDFSFQTWSQGSLLLRKIGRWGVDELGKKGP